jgi:excisionase family DNA binding protein
MGKHKQWPDEAVEILHRYMWVQSTESVARRITKDCAFPVTAADCREEASRQGINYREALGNVLLADAIALLKVDPKRLKRVMAEHGMKLVGSTCFSYVKLEDYYRLEKLLKPVPLPEGHIDVNEVARIIGYSKEGVRKLINTGRMSSRWVDGRHYVPRHEAIAMARRLLVKSLSVSEAANQLGYCEEMIRRLIKRGQLQATRRGNKHRIPLTEIARFKEELRAAQVHSQADPGPREAAAPRHGVGVVRGVADGHGLPVGRAPAPGRLRDEPVAV